SVHGLADSISQGVMLNDLDFLKNYLPRILAVSAEDVQRVAKKYFEAQKRVVVWSVPKKGAKGEGRGATEEEKPPARGAGPGAARKARQSTTSGSGEFSLKDAKRVELPNGLVVLLFENHRLPIVVAQALVRNVRLHEPEEQAGVAALTGALLDEGT